MAIRTPRGLRSAAADAQVHAIDLRHQAKTADAATAARLRAEAERIDTTSTDLYREARELDGSA
jgi:hypothetical protein